MYIYAELRKVPNVRTLDAVFPGIEVMVSDENTRRIPKGGRKILRNREENEGGSGEKMPPIRQEAQKQA